VASSIGTETDQQTQAATLPLALMTMPHKPNISSRAKRTKHHVYYVNDTINEVVYIVAVWGAPKEGEPILHDPLR